jgi:hypothetical protein
VELTPLAARVDRCGEVREQIGIVDPPGKDGWQRVGIDADEARDNTCRDTAASERSRVETPQRKLARDAESGEALFSIPTHILEEEIAKSDSASTVLRTHIGEGSGEHRIVGLVRAMRLEPHLMQGKTECTGLCMQELSVHPVHADAIVACRDAREQSSDVVLLGSA